MKFLQGSSTYFFLPAIIENYQQQLLLLLVIYFLDIMSQKQEGLTIYDRNISKPVISTNSFTKIKGEISRGTFLIELKDLQSFSACLKDEAIAKYGTKLTSYVLNAIGTLNRKLYYELAKNWIVFRDDNGNISYYGLLKRNVKNLVMVGVYEFSIDFTIDKNVHLKRFQKYEQETSFFGGTDSVYIAIDELETRSRGLQKKDLELLFHYTQIIENQFSIASLENIK